MKKVGVVTDSHSGITIERAKELGVSIVPMPFAFGDEIFYENVNITHDEFFERLRNGEKVSTAQPTPEDVTRVWDEVLSECEEIVYIPMSSSLSGGCNTARVLAMDEPYEGKVFVVDNGRVSATLHRAVLDALDMVSKGYGAAAIKDILEQARAHTVIYLGVDDLSYLKNGGRISGASAFIGGMLNIKPVLKFDTGLLDKYKESRGMMKARKEMIAAMKHDFETRFAPFVEKNEMYLLAASSADETVTESWIAEIKAAFPGYEVLYDNLTFGLSCHTGPGALGIACSAKPEY